MMRTLLREPDGELHAELTPDRARGILVERPGSLLWVDLAEESFAGAQTGPLRSENAHRVGLVDDEYLVLGQHVPALEGVDGHEGEVGHDDVDLARPVPCQLAVALLGHRAPLPAEALPCAHRHLPPGPLAHPGDEPVPVPGVGLLRPRPEPHDLPTQPGDGARVAPLGCRRLVRAGPGEGEEGVLLLGEPPGQLVHAEVVAPPLDELPGGTAPEPPGDGVGEPRQLPVHDLGLEGEGRGRHHDRNPLGHRPRDGGDQVGQ